MHPMPKFDDWTGPTPEDEDLVIDLARARTRKSLSEDVAQGRRITDATERVALVMFMVLERAAADKNRAEREAIVATELARIFQEFSQAKPASP